MASEGVGALNVKVMKFKQARVNGWRNYDSLKAKCPHIPRTGADKGNPLFDANQACNCLRECWRNVISAQCIAWPERQGVFDCLPNAPIYECQN